MKKTRMEKGITLIALIITIVVLLILAVVAISAIQNDGILSYAEKSSAEYQIVQLKEEITLIMNERKINSVLNSNQKTLKEDLERIKGAEVSLIQEDIYTVKRDEYTVTVYGDGDTLTGEVAVWDGTTSKVPQIQGFNWYISNRRRIKVFGRFSK